MKKPLRALAAATLLTITLGNAHIFATGLGLLVLIGFVWFGGSLPRPQTVPTERPPMPPAAAVSPVPVVPQDPAAPEAGQRVDLQAVADELAAVPRQQDNAFAALRQQQETKLAMLQQRLEQLFTAQHALTQQFDDLALRAANDDDAFLTTDDASAARAEQAAGQVTQSHEAQAMAGMCLLLLMFTGPGRIRPSLGSASTLRLSTPRGCLT